MNIRIITVGKTSQPFIREGLNLYLDRLSHYGSIELIELPVSAGKATSPEAQVDKESGAITRAIKPSDYAVMCHDTGKEMNSEEFATWMQKKMNSGTKCLSFIIGGAYGVNSEVRQRANESLSFSRMTFTHDMIRLVLAEQLYRAHTILKGEKYHH